MKNCYDGLAQMKSWNVYEQIAKNRATQLFVYIKSADLFSAFESLEFRY